MHEKHIWSTEYDLWSNIFIRVRQAVEIWFLGKMHKNFKIIFYIVVREDPSQFPLKTVGICSFTQLRVGLNSPCVICQ